MVLSAIRRGDQEALEEFVASFPNALQIKTIRSHDSLLMTAVTAQQLEIFEYLLVSGADVNASNNVESLTLSLTS